MQKLILTILIISSFLFLSIIGRSQTLTITNVSVINSEGHVRISWEYDGFENLEIFRDSTEKLSSLHLITDLATNSFIDYSARAHLKPRLYKISSSIQSDIVSTYYLSFNYDSCLRQIQLKWKDKVVPIPYNNDSIINDWTPSLFNVNIIKDGDLQKINVNATKSEYSIQNILENTNYKIFIETQWIDTDSTSNSNPIIKFTQMPLSPDYINSISASADGDNTNLKFEVDPNSELDTYKLLKSDSPSGVFDTLETIYNSSPEIIVSDYDSDPDTKVNYYKLISVNACNHETTNSNVINNVVLQVSNKEFTNNLTWNNFKEGSLVPVNYDIYRVIEFSEPELIGNISNHNNFNDNIESLQSYSQFCYFIRATEEGAFDIDFSQSNTICAYLKPKIYIPEAFTPNKYGENSKFKAEFTFIPKEFELTIYNRWGNVVFETSDYTNAWNGKESNGNYAPAGSYIYHLKMRSPNNQIIDKMGNIMVIYP